VPVDVPGGAHAPALEPPRVEVHLDVLGSRHRAPGAGARAMAIDGEEDGLEGDPARVRAREHDETEVDVGDGESAGGAWGEREVEARGGGVEWEEDGGVEGLVRRITGRGVGDARRVEEVAEVGWRAGKNAGGAAPAVAGERRRRMRRRATSESISAGTASASGDSFSGGAGRAAAQEARGLAWALRPLLLPRAMSSVRHGALAAEGRKVY
jgi:hypothetical protein